MIFVDGLVKCMRVNRLKVLIDEVLICMPRTLGRESETLYIAARLLLWILD